MQRMTLAVATVFVLFLGMEYYSCVTQGPTKTAPAACKSWTFDRYEPSLFEWKFLENADAWGQYPCRAMINLKAEADEWVHLAALSMQAALPKNTTSSVLSSLFFRSCEGVEERVLIEPIGGCLRNPYTCDDLHRYYLDKDSWMIIDWRSHPMGSKNFMFDVGASTWLSGGGGASQVWMWEQYRKRGIEFDAFYAWEATSHVPQSIWEQIPAEVRPRYHWFNIPAQSTAGAIDNPLEILRRVAKPEDFVVLKLDIDTPSVEMPLVEQIANDPGIAALIDEFFFEHHVNVEPLASCCWMTTKMNETGASSFRLFSKLRRLGIRAHSWV